MRLCTTILPLAVLFLVGVPLAASAGPPDHAPAHGYRAKHDDRGHDRSKHDETSHHRSRPDGGIEIVFDSERGIYVGVELPNIFFHDGTYYRESGSRWQISANGRGDWNLAATTAVPPLVVKAGTTSKQRNEDAQPKQKRRHPGPAKLRWSWDH